MKRDKNIPYGYCHCGCGKKTNIAKVTRNNRGQKKGEPVHFIYNHHLKGEKNNHWKGGQCKTYDGYIIVLDHDHPCADSDGYIRRSRMIMEKYFNMIFPKEAVFHHINGIRTDDDPNNIIVFENQSEHLKAHQEEIAFNACGHRSWRKCSRCHEYDYIENMVRAGQRGYAHPKCNQEYNKKRWIKIKKQRAIDNNTANTRVTMLKEKLINE